jgi:hypothetical protein
MTILRILANAGIMASEIAAVVALAAFAYFHPFWFAAATAGISFVLGMRLEIARLRYELPFYFGGVFSPGRFMTASVGFLEATFKAIVAGVAALFTFAGTNTDRLFLIACAFGVCVYAGASLLRFLSIRGEALPMRWGYFRLAPLLGLLFSVLIAGMGAVGWLPQTSVSDIGWKIIFDTPARPSIEQVSELLFQIKQAFDHFVVSLLSQFVSIDTARVIAIVLSVNVLSGFVSALYAAIIATGVRRAENALL